MSTYRELLTEATRTLARAGIPTPFLDALLILSHASGLPKEALLASYPEPVPPETRRTFESLLARRLAGEPVSYIRGLKEFYGLTFHVDRRVLVPRPDTEVLVDAALTLIRRDPAITHIHDACTGTGCILIAILTHTPRPLTASASDVSEEALDVFRENASRLLGTVPPHHRSDLLSSVPGRFHLITANPPYLTEEEVAVMKASGWPEPALALASGPDGLSHIRRLIPQALDHLVPGGYLICEHHDAQADAVAELYREAGYTHVRHLPDLAGRRRATLARRPL
ncbi:protein-(glutamine-N5) methyltransferase, release factor-specific [Spirochaeta thermophila DSM 6578]|uniref:Release factor glutamine methyltransferase n=1 Tax=Winmispira thermophila (strain ATCC 700085 / DSM 6578 / Z-1203) TaxID=869211 RepID=G0GDV3_WINT7|nr:peptide chain release factor N(5)-glutamine methyltransferase [Spirochaeta thermophila]AEJ62233.1 protein-(glutamine-N5) methyltransferase, release factor-specific [Spirochaeta thermophila DSM 6578]